MTSLFEKKEFNEKDLENPFLLHLLFDAYISDNIGNTQNYLDYLI